MSTNTSTSTGTAASTAASTAANTDIRGVLIQIAGARLLLPNATIAEVLSFADPEPIENAPDWLLGRIRWRGWQLPLIAFARLSGIAEEKGGLGSKVVVLKALGGNAQAPFFALLTQGFPRLVTVSSNALVAEEDSAIPLPSGVRARVLLNEDAALLPDLEQVEHLIGQALAAAA
jgi:chemosensory pili system protein ChpC